MSPNGSRLDGVLALTNWYKLTVSEYPAGSLVKDSVDVVVDVDSHLEILEFSEMTGTSTVAFEYGCAA